MVDEPEYRPANVPENFVSPNERRYNLYAEDSDYGSIKITRSGEVSYGVVIVTDDYTARANDRVILMNQSSGTKTITLPESEGKVYTVKALAAIQVDVQGASSNIDGAATDSLTSQYETVTYIFYNSAWHVIGTA